GHNGLGLDSDPDVDRRGFTHTGDAVSSGWNPGMRRSADREIGLPGIVTDPQHMIDAVNQLTSGCV
ncbi:MAG TPA: hypothetical protein VFZ25_08585, partial [Chloroflexota bacterium]|nr:hypothetical protein [Chloroflexota bacterium]